MKSFLFLLFCIVSATIAWSIGHQPPPAPAKPVVVAKPLAPVAKVAPIPPAWKDAGQPDFAWPQTEEKVLVAIVQDPRSVPEAEACAHIIAMSEDDVKAGRMQEFIVNLRGRPGSGPLIGAAFARWAAVSPVEAMEFCLTLPPAEALEGLKAGLPIWTQASPTAALAWAMSQYHAGTLPGGLVHALPSISYQWARQDMAGAFNLVQGLEALVGGAGPQAPMRTGIGTVALLDDQRETALNQIRDYMTRSADTDPADWKDYLQPLCAQQPALAAEWLERQGSSLPVAHLDVAVNYLLKQWVSADPNAFIRWAGRDAIPATLGDEAYKVDFSGGKLTVIRDGAVIAERAFHK